MQLPVVEYGAEEAWAVEPGIEQKEKDKKKKAADSAAKAMAGQAAGPAAVCQAVQK